MNTTLNKSELFQYINRLLQYNLPDFYQAPDFSENCLDLTLQRLEYCFSRIKRKYYMSHGEVQFDHLNGDHMATLLYLYSNTVWREYGDVGLCTRLFYLNRLMHSVDIFYSVELPNIFLLVHPIGSVLGHAKYCDYLVVYQNVTVGATTNNYPIFNGSALLYSKTSIIGDCNIGKNTVFASNASLIDYDVPDNTLVAGQYPKNKFHYNNVSVEKRAFSIYI